MLKSENLERKIRQVERQARCVLRGVIEGALENHIDTNYKKINKIKIIESYKNMGCRMTLKLNFLHSHLDFFEIARGRQ